MGSNPINLAVRLLLEMFGLLAIGYWGWSQHDGMLRILLAIGVPLLAATLWGVFAVPQDPSRSGGAPVPVPGVVRLGLEIAFFAFATWALFNAGAGGLGSIFGAIAAAHYALSYDRILWLINQGGEKAPDT